MVRLQIYIIWISILFFITPLFSTNLELSWIENTEPDLAGYHVFYGHESRNYEHKEDAGLNDSFVLNGLEDQVEYYFAITAYDTAGNESGYSAEAYCVLNDPVPLKIDSVKALTSFNIIVYFNKKVRSVSADQFSIDQNIIVQSAVLLSNQRTVRLITSNHQADNDYSLSVSGVNDISLPPNTIGKEAIVYHVDSDISTGQAEPYIEYIDPVSPTSINLFYNVPVLAPELNPDNYSIKPSVQVVSIEQVSDYQVKLNTIAHIPGELYTIKVTLPSTLTDSVLTKSYYYTVEKNYNYVPVVELVHLPNKNQVEVLFNNPVNASALGFFEIDPSLPVYSTTQDSSRHLVILNTGTHKINTLYTLKFNGNSLLPETGIPQPFEIGYQYQEADTLSPALQSVSVIDATHIQVQFTEPMALESATTPANYHIDHNIQIYDVVPGASGDEFVLETSGHSAFQRYELTLSGLTDNSIQLNPISEQTRFDYIYSPDNSVLQITKISVVDSTSLDIFFNRTLDEAVAQDISNYQINNGITVIDAHLHADNTAVRMFTSEHQENQIYTLHTTGELAEQQKAFQSKLDLNYTYIYKPVDTIGPVIKAVYSEGPENIVILFNESPCPDEAENINNYQIVEGIEIRNAQLNRSNNTVHLYTEAHPLNKTFTLEITNIRDADNEDNICLPGTRFPYVMTVPDHAPPYIKQIQALSPEKLLLKFSEPFAGAAVLRPESYSIDHDIRVLDLKATSPTTIEMTTTPQSPGEQYLFWIKSAADKAGNFMPEPQYYYYSYQGVEYSRVYVTFVEPVNESQVMVSFSYDVSRTMAENINNYHVTNCEIKSAQLVESNKVLLSLSGTTVNHGYSLWIGEISDAKISRSTVPANYFYYVGEEYNTKLELSSVNTQGANQVLLAFNRKLDWSSVSDVNQYQISPQLDISRASLLDDDQTVLLETGAHCQAVPYQIRISGLHAVDADITSFSHYHMAYSYIPVLDVLVKNMFKANMENIEVGKTYYNDRDYIITSLPENLKQARLIKTDNDDKSDTGSSYLSLQLTEPGVVYIAYDMRAESVPDWLRANFKETENKLGVSDQPGKMALWRGYFGAGKLVLGGNFATGAVGVKSMYVVIVGEPTAGNMDEFQQPAGEDNLPEAFSVSQNFPNPFNPVTHIKYELNAGQYVRMSIYNVLGQRVRVLVDSYRPAGYYLVTWDGRNDFDTPVAAGIYFYRFDMWDPQTPTGAIVKTVIKKMLFVK